MPSPLGVNIFGISKADSKTSIVYVASLVQPISGSSVTDEFDTCTLK
ncbi:MAG TPA: hypothetical protein PK638_03620 [Candidatus Enterocola sp.]|nr:hypothetical protein [Candidatus Enterocola sp.]